MNDTRGTSGYPYSAKVVSRDRSVERLLSQAVSAEDTRRSGPWWSILACEIAKNVAIGLQPIDWKAWKLRTLLHRIKSHWHGEQDLIQVFGPCLMVIAVPALAGCIAAVLLNSFLPSSVRGTASFILNTGLFLSILAGIWWCKGVHAMWLKSLQTNRMIRAALLFLTAIQGVCWIATAWIPEFARSAHEDWTQVWHPAATNAESWSQKPLQILVLPELQRISATGSFGWGSAKALEAAIKENPNIHLLEVESKGGYVHEADLIVNLIQKHGLNTLARGKCYSACTLIFLAGQRRYVGPEARFGFHQSGYKGRERDTEWRSSEYESALFFRGQGVRQDFMDTALNTSYYDLWRPHIYDVKTAGFATHWWSERSAGL